VITFESGRVRHVVARIERGERLPDALVAIAEKHAIATAWLDGLGAFRWVELCEYDQTEQRYKPSKRIDAPTEILSLQGNMSFRDGKPFAHVHVTVSRETADGIEVLGGHLVAGEVFACELRIAVYDDLALGRERDAATGLALWKATSTPLPMPLREDPHSRATPARGVSWDDVAKASALPPRVVERPRAAPRPNIERAHEPVVAPSPLPQKRRTTEAEFFDEPIPVHGDWVQHEVFGLCRVDGEDGDGALLIRLPSGVRKSIKLDVLSVGAAREEGDRRIYPLRPRRR
jgi:predicted DNA-binding protein with PD1-like motif